ncbi:MAG: glycosyltransferase family 9 protein, partial [Planctomycetota bacterium]
MTPETARWARDPQRPRLLIARMSAIGDTILTAPVAVRLRERFPDAFIAWVVEQKASRFVVGHPAIDEAVVLPRGWFVSAKGVAAARAALRPLRIDASIDCQSNTKSALACWLSGARTRIGCRGRYGAELSPLLNNRLVRPATRHLTDRSLELLGPLGFDPAGTPDPGVGWRLPMPPGAQRAVADWLVSDEAPAHAETGFAVINPGATWDSKRWEMDRFGAIAERLGRRWSMPTVVVWGDDREHADAERIVAASDGAAIVGPPTTLPELASLLSQTRLLVSGDTGPMHLGVAVGAPTVGLFGATDPRDCGPYGAPHEAVSNELLVGGRKKRRRADNSAM